MLFMRARKKIANSGLKEVFFFFFPPQKSPQTGKIPATTNCPFCSPQNFTFHKMVLFSLENVLLASETEKLLGVSLYLQLKILQTDPKAKAVAKELFFSVSSQS